MFPLIRKFFHESNFVSKFTLLLFINRMNEKICFCNLENTATEKFVPFICDLITVSSLHCYSNYVCLALQSFPKYYLNGNLVRRCFCFANQRIRSRVCFGKSTELQYSNFFLYEGIRTMKGYGVVVHFTQKQILIFKTTI